MKISTPAALAIIAFALLAASGITYYRLQDSLESAPAALAFDPALPFHTEEEWAALQVAQSLADLGSLASDKNAKPEAVRIRRVSSSDATGRYELDWKGKRATVSMDAGVWNPATYAPWAKTVLAAPDPAAPPARAMDCAQTLLDPQLGVFLSENRRISDFLTAHPSSAAGHLQAALLVGTLALNDYSCVFRDLRIPLNRLTAHLAAADAWGTPAADAGRRLAESIRLTLCGQQADALASLGPKPSISNEPSGQWDAILRLRNTLDWRDGRAAALAGSPALQNEYFRTLVYAVNVTTAVKFLKETGAKPNVACWRIANEVPLSVENGHLFSEPILGLELQEIAKAAEAFGIPVSKDNLKWLAEYLDTPEGSPVVPGPSGSEIQVAGRNLLAGYHQRHFFEGANQLFYFLNDLWSVPENVAQLRTFLEKNIPPMRYTPFLARLIACTDAQRRKANPICEAVIFKHPEMVTPALWQSLRMDRSHHKVLPAPDFNSWFHPEVPQGTAFDTGDRLFQIGVGDESDPAWLKTLWQRAPYSYAIAMQNAFIENHGTYDHLDPAVAIRWLGPLADYDIRALRRVAKCAVDQPALYKQVVEKAAALDPDLYVTLGEYFEARGMDEDAAGAYLQAFTKANDRVSMANQARWLVEYLYAKGDFDQAAKVAAEAAEVYSYRGLEAYQWLMEKQGKWDRALETARKIDERYNDLPVCELSCLIHGREASPDQAKTMGGDAKLTKFFPDGVRPAKLSDFSGPPAKGSLIQGSSPALNAFGLRDRMVIVALDGYRIDSFAQYMVIRALTDDPKMRLIVWDGSSYREIEKNLPERRFGVEMVDYKKP